jgi:hypothetical protein
VDVVALTELATSPDVEAPLLASDLGVTPYEARQKLAVGMPCVVLFTEDRARTTALMGSLRARGHGVVACEGRAVAPSAAMQKVRRFRFEPDALVLRGPSDAADGSQDERLPYAEMLALLRATHRRTQETREETKEKKFRPAAAIITGGVILTKTVTREVVRTNEDKEQVVYVFRRSGAPCLLREGGADYSGLGEAVLPTRIQNFATTLRLLREHAPRVPYDERLVSVKRLPELPGDLGAPRAFDRETGGMDLLAHVLAMWLSRGT